VLRFHGRHAHVPGGRATIDRQDMLLAEAEECEEGDRRFGVGDRNGNVIRIEEHPVTLSQMPLRSTSAYAP